MDTFDTPQPGCGKLFLLLRLIRNAEEPDQLVRLDRCRGRQAGQSDHGLPVPSDSWFSRELQQLKSG